MTTGYAMYLDTKTSRPAGSRIPGSRVLGRSQDEPTIYVTTTALNIRSGPDTQFDSLAASPLPPATRLHALGAQGTWRLVDVLDEVAGINDLQGWVHARFITEA